MEQTKHQTFRRRVDGVLGVGFLVQRCGTSQAAIAWPDRGCEHFNADDLERNGVEELGSDATALGGQEEQAVTDTASEASENQETAEKNAEEQPVTEVQAIRNYLADHGSGATNKAVVEALQAKGFNVSSSQVSRVKASLKSEATA